MAERSAKLGVLFFNLGGPERLEDVKPFLYNLFSDPEIIRIRSGVLRRAVAWFIATTRAPKSRGYYQKIGGGSPLRRTTEAQAAALEAELEARGSPARVYVGMQCWSPTIDEAVARIAADGVERLVILPLYPQFSMTTTGSALKAFEEVVEKRGLRGRFHTEIVRQWHDHSGYVAALAATVRDGLAAFPDPDPAATHVVYSAHSIPTRYVEEGDPYLEQTQQTVAAVNAALGAGFPWTLAFQSKVGPVKWLEPSTDSVLRELGARGTKQLLMVPVSFVSDHIETLYEIDILYRDLAAEAGVGCFRRAAALNLSPAFIAALGDLVRSVAADQASAGDARAG